MAFLDFPFPNEIARYYFLHPIMRGLVRKVSIVDIHTARAKYDRDDMPLPEKFQIEYIYGRQWQPLKSSEEVPEDRHPASFVHYGIGGVLPTLLELARIFFQQSDKKLM